MKRLAQFVYVAMAALILPATVSAFGPLRTSACNDCDGGQCGRIGRVGGCKSGKFAGLFGALANHPPAYPQKHGFGFFQPPFQAAPWYLYWPYDAHFQLPAPIGAPFQPPQHLGQPWNPYFAHPNLGIGQEPVAPAVAPSANAISQAPLIAPNR